MRISDQQIDKITTVGFMAAGFLFLIFFASKSIDFQKRCEARCGVQPALTPIVEFQEQCLCGEGNGKWRREDIGSN